jgi:hypothetical protein
MLKLEMILVFAANSAADSWPLSVQVIVDAILTIRRDNKPLDLFMVELQQMIHKTDIDTK